MKTLIIITAIALSSLSAKAQSFVTEELSMTSVLSGLCVAGGGQFQMRHGGLNRKECAGLMSASTTSSVLGSLTVAAVLKEEVKNVQPDAHNYLAGGPMTYALEEVIAKLKDENEQLVVLSEAEMVALIIDLAASI